MFLAAAWLWGPGATNPSALHRRDWGLKRGTTFCAGATFWADPPHCIRPLYIAKEKGVRLLFDPDEGVCDSVCVRVCRAVAPVVNEASPERPQVKNRYSNWLLFDGRWAPMVYHKSGRHFLSLESFFFFNIFLRPCIGAREGKVQSISRPLVSFLIPSDRKTQSPRTRLPPPKKIGGWWEMLIEFEPVFKPLIFLFLLKFIYFLLMPRIFTIFFFCSALYWPRRNCLSSKNNLRELKTAASGSGLAAIRPMKLHLHPTWTRPSTWWADLHYSN